MLKRLELVGFKSFADKTTFEFGHGITAIVGPNGSGKSNIVDAVRWILGEQSAKSLRGGEMTDVIFNGSASRRSFGMAEVTISFDNARQLLASDAEEVRITRRVYRSGEGEYLINGQQCRLKDIKDLFLGSGAGTDAYSIIAQGKVDVLLQASTKERRTIFEEAAGISRFKAKKIETMRKLERVDQNVQRLRDIIDEVEKQLRSVKLQAAKAQRYQEYHGRLKELRIGLSLREYHELSLDLEEEDSKLGNLRQDLEQRGVQVTEREGRHLHLEQVLATLQEQIEKQESTLGQARQQIRARETTLDHEHALSGDLEGEMSRLRKQVNELTGYLTGLSSAWQKAEVEWNQAQTDAENQRQKVHLLEESFQAIVIRLEQLQELLRTDKNAHLESMRESAHLQNDAVSFKAQVDNLTRELSRLRHKSEQAVETLASIDVELEELTSAEQHLQGRLTAARSQLSAEKGRGEDLRQSQERINDLLSQLRQQKSGLISRAEVLEGLERSHEGLGTGVGELLDLLQQSRKRGDNDCPWLKNVVGMVGDLLNVRREFAPLIDLALMDQSQYFIVRDGMALALALADREEPFSGRVSFLPLQDRHYPGAQAVDRVQPAPQIQMVSDGRAKLPNSLEEIPSHPALVARADHLVQGEREELTDLPYRLLGRTYIVQDLESARALANGQSGFRLVTLNGEVLEPDGSLTVGTYHPDTGILSRKSELREIRDQLADLEVRIAHVVDDLAQMREAIAISDSRVQNHQQEIQVLSEQIGDLRSRLEMHRDRRNDLHEEVVLSQDEIQQVESEIAKLQLAWQEAQRQAASAEEQVRNLQVRMAQTEVEIREQENHRQERHQDWTSSKVALAKAEERVESLRDRYHKLRQDWQQRRQEVEQAHANLDACKHRLRDSQLTMLLASADLAIGYVIKEQAEHEISKLLADRGLAREEKNLLGEEMQKERNQWQSQQEQFHGHELQANNLRHKIGALCDRLHEDYQMDLGQLYQEAKQAGLWDVLPEAGEVIVAREVEEESSLLVELDAAGTEVAVSDSEIIPVEPYPWQIPDDLDAANDEIAELKRKLNRLGSVNLDALQELQDLDIRTATLTTQYEDLTSAKRSLEEIISKINLDSRRLFMDNFEMIRRHFQELFRKLFGGGMADIVLEDENDVLESGIEIIARPPGKELRSISLMSGGEKTMTAVALLLSIFRSKPSPFCILDEVDAALDEANIGRFADVLRDFLDHSHFIIITHSKRTMAAADVIYGITMQESGISKRVSVRFEDWPEGDSSAQDISEVA